MKRFILTLTTIFICTITHAQTIDIDWLVDNSVYNQSTCEYGGDLIVPTAPTKYGYTFNGWVSFTPIEYLESTGTQYIDTGVKFYYNAQKLGFSLKTMSTQRPTAETEILSNDSFSQAGFNILATGKIQCFNAPWISSDISMITNNSYTTGSNEIIEFSGWFSNTGFFCSFAESPKLGTYSVYTNQTILIYKRRDINYSFYVGRIYYIKLFLDDILVRDFIPVLDKDGVPCMFDKVEGKFYYNAGTGNFIAGPVIGGE